MAKLFIIIGILLIILGLILTFSPGLLSWFGKLPGDININGKNTRLFIPIGSMIIISLLLTILLNIFKH